MFTLELLMVYGLYYNLLLFSYDIYKSHTTYDSTNVWINNIYFKNVLQNKN